MFVKKQKRVEAHKVDLYFKQYGEEQGRKDVFHRGFYCNFIAIVYFAFFLPVCIVSFLIKLHNYI